MNINTQAHSLNSVAVLSIILVEGFITIAVEMLTIRQLMPVVGNSVLITSLIIGIFLLFLALGYYRGGQCRGNYREVLKKNFTWSALLLGLGLSYLFIHLLFTALPSWGLVPLLIYLLLITAPLVYLLGQTVPITTNLFPSEQAVGAINGKVLGLSTFGSFLGSVGTTLILMHYFGVAFTVFFNFMLLAGLITCLASLPKDTFRLFGLILLGIFVFAMNIDLEKKLFQLTNQNADYQIIAPVTDPSKKVGRLLSINHAPSAFLNESGEGFPYIELIKKILFHDLQLQNKNILVLGAGGFTLSAEKTNANHFLYVDVEGRLPQLVKKGFIDKVEGQFIKQDARNFLLHSNAKFDAIVSDVYSSRNVIPFHLITKEHFELIRSALKPGAVAIFNVIANPMMQDDYSVRVDNTLQKVFPGCMRIPISYSNHPVNIIYVCTVPKRSDATIYTDDRNASMMDIYQLTAGN